MTAWKVQDRAYDPGTMRVGVIQQIDRRDHQVWLRPEHGGREWTAFISELQDPATAPADR